MGIRYELAGDTVQVVTDEPREVAARLLAGCNAKRVLSRVTTLEDVFLKLTGRGLKE
jgi:lipooligosaccharide transport system ATP-binding protein